MEDAEDAKSDHSFKSSDYWVLSQGSRQNFDFGIVAEMLKRLNEFEVKNKKGNSDSPEKMTGAYFSSPLNIRNSFEDTRGFFKKMENFVEDLENIQYFGLDRMSKRGNTLDGFHYGLNFYRTVWSIYFQFFDKNVEVSDFEAGFETDLESDLDADLNNDFENSDNDVDTQTNSDFKNDDSGNF